ncbi:YdeI/OmpD-associated family protein [Mucilaginibacter sp. NFX135]|uniref:YdeI/OmpD-associated family protein n=1 Tax=Mucilaginibacter sp. NFX135 TaxID=3402687 RepID=UPI003AFAEAB7
MSKFNPQFDEYIEKSADFAKPIMEYLRQIIHETCPKVEEIIKWGNPHFDYKGDMMCILAGYKNHCSFSLYKAELMSDTKIIESVKAGQKMGYMDKLKSLSDLPAKETLIAYIKEAMALNENGVKKAKPVSEKPKVIEVPDYFSEKLTANPLAKEIFESKSASFRKDYLVWITDAKTEATRQKRIEQSMEWIAEGKGRFWQYEK